jgi:hypothetical protein
MTVSYSFSDGYWIAERALVTVTSATTDGDIRMRVQTKYSLQSAWATRVDATYKADGDGKVVIDVTDALRAYANASGVFAMRVLIDEVTEGSYNTHSVSVQGLINPAKILIPPHDMDLCEIVPPTHMLFLDGDSVQTELYSSETVFYDVSSGGIVISPSQQDTHGATVEIVDWNVSFLVGQNGQPKQGASRHLTPLRCDVQYAYVEWQSSITGKTRAHWFEVSNHKIAADGNYSLLTMDNSYDERKGRLEAFSLRLDNLDVYDLWYYADVLFSSKVRVTIDNSTYEQVQVTTKNITIPDGEAGTKGEIEINVNFKRYDPAIM